MMKDRAERKAMFSPLHHSFLICVGKRQHEIIKQCIQQTHAAHSICLPHMMIPLRFINARRELRPRVGIFACMATVRIFIHVRRKLWTKGIIVYRSLGMYYREQTWWLHFLHTMQCKPLFVNFNRTVKVVKGERWGSSVKLNVAQ